MSIVDYSIPYPDPTINTTYFPNTHTTGYWSSTTCASSFGGTNLAWLVGFDSGWVYVGYKSGNGYVRCVRGEQSSSPSFTDNGNGTVTDNGTGLMWQRGEPGSKTWADALTYCEGLNLGGQSDWRLPNVKELESITDDTKDSPAIDTTYFPTTNSYCNISYWSSTTFASGTNLAWFMLCDNGSVSIGGGKSDYNYARCVRGQSGASNNQNKCAATVSSNLAVYVPIITYGGSNYWASLQYDSSTGQLTIADAGALTSVSAYSSCTASTLSSDFKLHIPVLMLNGVSYWVDLEWKGDAFVITGAGQN